MDFIYTVNAYAEEPIMLIDRHIGFDPVDGMGVDGAQFQRELLALDDAEMYGKKKRVQVWINSPGGSVSDGFNIYNAILHSKNKVDTYCNGMAASTAGWVFQAGRNRYMADYGFLMMHNPYNPDGSEDKGLQTFKNSIATMLATRSGRSVDECGSMMDEETWLSASDAMTKGFCDSIVVSSEHNRKRMAAALTAQDRYRVGADILNNAFHKQEPKMQKVANKLGLNADANEESIMAAIAAIENARDVAVQNATHMEKTYTEAEEQLNAKKARVEELENELNALKSEMEATTNKAKLEAANAMLTPFIGKQIKNDETIVNKWRNLAITDLEGTKSMIEALPVNATAPKIGQDGEAAVPYSAAGRMAEIANKNKK